MRRLIYDKKSCSFIWKDWKPVYISDFGESCVKKNKYVEDKVRINNNEVSTGTSRTALYTMPGGVDNGVRYAPLYESSGLDITEIEANKKALQNAKEKASDMIKEEFDKISTETVYRISQQQSKSDPSASSGCSE